MMEGERMTLGQIAESIADDLGAVWPLALLQRARLAGRRVSLQHAANEARAVARRRGWPRHTVKGLRVRSVYAPAGQLEHATRVSGVA